MKKIVWLILILLSIIFTDGCGSPATTSHQRGDIESYESGKEFTASDIDNLIATSESEYKYSWTSEVWSKLDSFCLYPIIKTEKITYWTKDANNNDIKVTGALIYPHRIFGSLSVPLISLQHPTQTERSQSPSWVIKTFTQFDNQLTIPTALVWASLGYAVCIADYPGLGDNYNVHPYCHTSLANSIIDLIRTTNRVMSLNGSSTTWNGKLYLIGYSEGGYATLAAAKDIQLNYSSEFNVQGVVGLDGPYSLSQTMRNVMLTATAEFSAPYFLPYFIAGYDSAYKQTYPDFDFYGAVTSEVPNYTPPSGSDYAHELYKLLNGNYTGSEISDFMRKATFGGQYSGPKSILTNQFVSKLSDESSVIVQKLTQNNAYDGWTPSTNFRIYHNDADDLVPFGNFEQAKLQWDTLSSDHFQSFHFYDQTLVDLMGSVHASTLPLAYYKGFYWIDSLDSPIRGLPLP